MLPKRGRMSEHGIAWDMSFAAAAAPASRLSIRRNAVAHGYGLDLLLCGVS